jgi:hypothetical protein
VKYICSQSVGNFHLQISVSVLFSNQDITILFGNPFGACITMAEQRVGGGVRSVYMKKLLEVQSHFDILLEGSSPI